jgi:hypothetical protein
MYFDARQNFGNTFSPSLGCFQWQLGQTYHDDPAVALHQVICQCLQSSLLLYLCRYLGRVRAVIMSVLLETSAGDIVMDLLVDHAPKLCEK